MKKEAENEDDDDGMKSDEKRLKLQRKMKEAAPTARIEHVDDAK